MADNQITQTSGEEIYRLVAESSCNWDELLGPDGSFRYNSPSCERITGYSAEEFSKDPNLFLNLIYPEDRPIVAEHLRQVMAQECKKGEFEFRILHKNGELRWLSHCCQAIFDQEGKWLGQRGSYQDVSARKLAEAAVQDSLRENVETIKTLINFPSDIIMLLDIEGHILVSNETFAEISGIPVDRLVGRSFWDLLPPEAARFRRSIFEEVLRTGQPARVEDRRSIGSGPEILYDSIVYPIFDPRGKITRVAIVARDITERKKTEELLQQKEVLLRNIILNAPIILLAVDKQGMIELLEGEDLNRVYTTGLDAVGKSAYTFFKDQPEVIAGLQGALAGQESILVTRLLQSQVFELRFAPIKNLPGQTVGATLTGINITEYMRIQDELSRSKQELEVILDGISDAIFVIDKDSNIIYANPAATQTARYSLSQASAGRKEIDSNWVALDEAGRLMDINQLPVRQALRGAINPPMMLRYRRNDTQEEKWVVAKATPIFNQDGEVRMAVYISHDITELKNSQQALELARAELEIRIQERTAELAKANLELRNEIFMRVQTEHALKQERDFIESLIQTAQVGMLLIDPEGKVLRMNRYFEEISGYQLEEIQGKDSFDTFFQIQDRGYVRGLFLQALENHNTYTNITPIITRDGSRRQMEWYGKTLTNDKDQPIGVLTIGHDITERIEIVEKLHHNIARAEALARVAARINAQLDLDAVLEAICEETVRAIPSMQISSVMLFNSESGSFQIAATAGYQAETLKQPSVIPLSVYQQFLDEFGPVIVIPDLRSLPALHYFHAAYHAQARTIVSVSLVHNNQLIGALNVNSLDEIHLFSEEELELIQALANQAAVAIANAQLFEQVSASKQRLQSLSQRLVEIQEIERHNLARELHDEIGQMLTSLNLSIDFVERETSGGGFSPRVQEELKYANGLINQLIKQIREISLDLRPGLLDDLGLVPALLSHFERYMALSGIRVDFKHSGMEQRFDGKIETTAFRIIQEALTNVTRHAKVNEVSVRLWCDEISLGIQVEDEGVGFDLQSVLSNGTTGGLLGMRERASLCGGSLDIISEPGGGTCLTADLPLINRSTEAEL